jgi:anti-sigma regulatory factor (Ser/Thr protein kinase)
MAVDTRDVVMGAGEHVVAFYEHESGLIDTVGRYLIAGVRVGEVVIVVATGTHLQGIEASLEAAGVDLARARAGGGYVSLDAVATLAAFVDDGRIDRGGFDQLMGGVVRHGAGTGRAVRAYGEMVALLWDAGNVLAAIELERLWNALRREVPFSLLCTYPSASFSGPGHVEALQEICHLHTAAHQRPGGRQARGGVQLAPPELAGEFPAEPGTPAAARRLAVDALRQWGHDDRVVSNAALVLTELVTNAVVHARSPLWVRVSSENAVVRIAVGDDVAARPAVRDAGPMAESGRGLHRVGALASRWGVDVTAHGKIVWAELRA